MAYQIMARFMEWTERADAATAEEACQRGQAFFDAHASAVVIVGPNGMPTSVEALRETLEGPPDA